MEYDQAVKQFLQKNFPEIGDSDWEMEGSDVIERLQHMWLHFVGKPEAGRFDQVAQETFNQWEIK